MATKFSYIFSCNFLLFILFSLFSHVKFSHSKGQESPAFGFLNNLIGCHKGDNVEGVYELKMYLKTFGYLSHLDANNVFDDRLESAIKTYQLNFHLEPTGILDSSTVSTMMTPRCGLPDIINGTNFMQSGNKSYQRVSSPLHIVSRYAFLWGKPKWPADHTNLTYAFLSATRVDAKIGVANAFAQWSWVSKFRFLRTDDYNNADIQIGFYMGDHGDGYPFDGPGGVIAHATHPPKAGYLHYDAAEHWDLGEVPGAFDMESVALHELGHILGLAHSTVYEAIMFPSFPKGATKGLAEDDIEAIKALYN